LQEGGGPKSKGGRGPPGESAGFGGGLKKRAPIQPSEGAFFCPPTGPEKTRRFPPHQGPRKKTRGPGGGGGVEKGKGGPLFLGKRGTAGGPKKPSFFTTSGARPSRGGRGKKPRDWQGLSGARHPFFFRGAKKPRGKKKNPGPGLDRIFRGWTGGGHAVKPCGLPQCARRFGGPTVFFYSPREKEKKCFTLGGTGAGEGGGGAVGVTRNILGR